MAPARQAAYDVLRAVATERADLPAALANAGEALADPRDRGLTIEISAGVERWRGTLDYLIAHFARRRIDHMDLEVVVILRMSAYQLLHLTRVPASAVVDDAVELTKRSGKRSAASFVNAVLRSLARARHKLPLPARPGEDAAREERLAYLVTALSHPEWLAARWLDRYGFEIAERWMQFNNAPAPLTLRANTRLVTRDALAERLSARDIATTPGRFAPESLLIKSGQPLQTDGLEAGWFVVQDEASQLVALLAGSAPGTRVLDACASPGNKAAAIAKDTDGLLVACDIRPRRMSLLAATIARTRASNIRMVQADLTRPLPFSAAFNTVIVDAPCSGLGTLRRDPDIRWRRQERDIPRLALAALDMLRNASAVVRPGGRLVYATCSSEPEENEDVVAAFLKSDPSFVQLDAREAHPSLPPQVVDRRGYLRTTPDQHGLEAFFGAVLLRTS